MTPADNGASNQEESVQDYVARGGMFDNLGNRIGVGD